MCEGEVEEDVLGQVERWMEEAKGRSDISGPVKAERGVKKARGVKEAKGRSDVSRFVG